jgi:electron transfer flavoprotein alpha/beta subunit
MKLVVLIRSPRVGPTTDEIVQALCPGDRAALSTALALAQADDGESSVTALSAAPRSDEAALTAALVAGAHRAVRIAEPSVVGADLAATYAVLGAGLRLLGFDLVLAGNRSADFGSGATGPAIAHMLRIPHVTAVSAVQLREDRKIVVTHRRERGLFQLQVELPALLAVTAGPPLPVAEPAASPPAIEPLNLAEVTLPFRRPALFPERQIEPARTSPEILDGVAGLAALLTRAKTDPSR